ncbi:MAG: MarR family transcriptional regulator [Deltaproteobacteria bacterium]|nr:MarR family transcriptional regulator [Deltaproteobacteria bacterium]
MNTSTPATAGTLGHDARSARQILEVIPRTMRIIRSELRLAAKSELSVPQFRILVHLGESALNNGQLADIQGVSVAAMSRMVDGLVRRGLIERTHDATDRRQVRLALTGVGSQTLERLKSGVQLSLAARISSLGTQPKEDLLNGLNVLEEVFK